MRSENGIAGSRSIPRTHGLGIVLAGDPGGGGIALSLSFDTNIPAVAGHPNPLVRLIGHSSALLRLAMCVAATASMVLLSSSRYRQDLASLFQQGSPQALRTPWVGAHLAAYGLFFGATGWLIGGLGRPSPQSLPVLLWIGTGAATGATWCWR